MTDTERGASTKGQRSIKTGLHPLHWCVFNCHETFDSKVVSSKSMCFPLFCRVGFDSSISVRLHMPDCTYGLVPVKISKPLLMGRLGGSVD